MSLPSLKSVRLSEGDGGRKTSMHEMIRRTSHGNAQKGDPTNVSSAQINATVNNFPATGLSQDSAWMCSAAKATKRLNKPTTQAIPTNRNPAASMMRGCLRCSFTWMLLSATMNDSTVRAHSLPVKCLRPLKNDLRSHKHTEFWDKFGTTTGQIYSQSA